MKYMEKINESELINKTIFHQYTNINFFSDVYQPPFR